MSETALNLTKQFDDFYEFSILFAIPMRYSPVPIVYFLILIDT